MPQKLALPAILSILFGITLSPLIGHTAPSAPARPAADVLFWSQTERVAGFPKMEDRFPVRQIAPSDRPYPLTRGEPLMIGRSPANSSLILGAFMDEQNSAGILVIQDGKVRLEAFNGAMGFGPAGRWTSFSVAKSFTSTLVGAAVRDGYIKSLSDPVTRYVPGLKGSAYDKVSVEQLLTMTSGVRWNEDYTNPKSDVAQLFSVKPDPGVDPTVSYMRKLPREAAPGKKWVYKTGETNLLGVLVTSATGKTLADYLNQSIWKPFGMASEAVWMIDDRGQEPGGCCLSATLEDYGRMGLFMMGGGMAGGKPVLPEGWIAAATSKKADIGDSGHGYGYQWWTNDDGTYEARGIFGQFMHIDPKRKLVVVILSAWPTATDKDRSAVRSDFLGRIVKAVDAKPQ